MSQDNDYYNKKNDQGKTDWSLLPWRAVESAARIMTIAIAPKEQGGKGYGLASWQDVPEGFFRYEAALIRHFIRRFVYGEIIDPDSGEPHTAHIICNAGFVFEKDRQLLEDGRYDKNFYEREEQPTQVQLQQVQLPHDIDYTDMFKQCDDTYEDVIRRTCEFAKPNTKEIYCTKCGVTYKDYLKKVLPIQCFHQWDIR